MRDIVTCSRPGRSGQFGPQLLQSSAVLPALAPGRRLDDPVVRAAGAAMPQGRRRVGKRRHPDHGSPARGAVGGFLLGRMRTDMQHTARVGAEQASQAMRRYHTIGPVS